MRQALKQALYRWRLKARSPDLRLGRGVTITDCTFGCRVSIGRKSTLIGSSIADFTYVGEYSRIVHTTIGKYCSLSSSLDIGTGSHPTSGFVSTHPIFYLARPRQGWTLAREDRLAEHRRTIVGNDVWIGSGVIVRDGVLIGDGVIVGAGAVVTKDLAPYGIYGGVPARLIRWRFEPRQIAFLLRLRWWDRSYEWLAEHHQQLHDVDAFMANFNPSLA